MSTHLDVLLLRRLKNALAEGEDHIGIFQEFTEDVEASHAKQLEEWTTRILAYEEGNMSPDKTSPYDIEGEGDSPLDLPVMKPTHVHVLFYLCLELTLSSITKRLTDEEAQHAKNNNNNIIPGRHAFLLEGISLEEDQ